jgi:hypothetical protein
MQAATYLQMPICCLKVTDLGVGICAANFIQASDFIDASLNSSCPLEGCRLYRNCMANGSGTLAFCAAQLHIAAVR